MHERWQKYVQGVQGDQDLPNIFLEQDWDSKVCGEGYARRNRQPHPHLFISIRGMSIHHARLCDHKIVSAFLVVCLVKGRIKPKGS